MNGARSQVMLTRRRRDLSGVLTIEAVQRIGSQQPEAFHALGLAEPSLLDLTGFCSCLRCQTERHHSDEPCDYCRFRGLFELVAG